MNEQTRKDKQYQTDRPPTQQIDRQNELLSAELAYVEQGLYIVPLHEPLFNDRGECCGCSCEKYYRSPYYRERLRERGKEKQFDPNFKCRTPGKHPRLKDWEAEASNDPAQIRAWRRKYPTANIGLAVGKSDLIAIDHDTYKDNYAGDTLITRTDEETPTTITQSGGTHLYFKKPAGKSYTNANNTLPAGVDIRCDGGMTVLAPSIGPSGNPYQWEDGYSILEINPLPLPKALEAILDEAHSKHTTAKAVTFTTPTTERPELIRWKISKTTRELINNPPPQGSRSEADYSVCLALAFAGATDDEILAVFQHYPIGTQGKYAERGDSYLALTIGRARKFAEENPRPDVIAIVSPLLLLVKTIDLKNFVPAGPGRRSLRKSATVALRRMKEENNLSVNLGKKTLAKEAGIDPKSARDAMALLNGVLFDVTYTEYGMTISLVDNCRLQKLHPSLANPPVFKRGEVSENDNDVYAPHMADEPFLSGTSRYMKKFIQDKSIELTIWQDGELIQEVTPDQVKEQYTTASGGEGVLLAYDTSSRIGDMTAQEYATETGLKLSAARTHLHRAESLGLAKSEREGSRGPKVYSFIPDFWEKIDELAPNMRTYKMTSRREDKRLENAQQWTKAALEEANKAGKLDEAEELEARFDRQAEKRIPHLKRLHEDLPEGEIIRLAYDVPAYRRSAQTDQSVRDYRTEARSAHRQAVGEIVSAAGAAMDAGKTTQDIRNEVEAQGFNKDMVRSVLSTPRLFLHAAQQTGQAFLFENIAQLQASGASRKEIIAQLEQGGFTPDEITAALSKPTPTNPAPALLFSGLSYADAWQQFTKLREQMPVAMAKNADGYYLQLRQVAA